MVVGDVDMSGSSCSTWHRIGFDSLGFWLCETRIPALFFRGSDGVLVFGVGLDLAFWLAQTGKCGLAGVAWRLFSLVDCARRLRDASSIYPLSFLGSWRLILYLLGRHPFPVYLSSLFMISEICESWFLVYYVYLISYRWRHQRLRA